MRAWLIRIGVVIVSVVAAAVAVDMGAAIYAEYRLARTLRAEANLGFDPWAGILGFPFVTQALAHRYNEVEIKASGVDRPTIGRVSLEATLHSVDLTQASWLISPDSPLPVAKVESRVLLRATYLGRYLGVNDLIVEPPPQETNDATGGTTESGISSGVGLVFTGTPKAAGLTERVSVSVDLSMGGPANTTLVLTATGIITGPGTADRQVPDDKLKAVLAAFSKDVPGLRLPFNVAPDREGVRGPDVIIEGIADGLTLRLDQFALT